MIRSSSPARRGDDDIDAAAEGIHLRILADAAEDGGVAEFQIPAVRAKAFGDLDGQFAGRAEHEAAGGANPRALAQNAGESARRNAARLAGAGLSATKHVTAVEDGRDGLGLDRGGGVVTLSDEGFQDRLNEPKIGKLHRIPKLIASGAHQRDFDKLPKRGTGRRAGFGRFPRKSRTRIGQL